VKLWPETIDAARTSLAARPDHKDEADADLVFITRYGHGWAKLGRFDPDAEELGGASSNNAVSKAFRDLATSLGIKGSFYFIRHSYRTNAGIDERVIDFTMGHKRADMGTVYTERIDDARLEAVAAAVHGWLFPAKPPKRKPKASKSRKPRKTIRRIFSSR